MQSSDDGEAMTTVRSSSDDRGKVLKFRPPKPSTESAGHARDVFEADLGRLLDLSKYERPREKPEEFKARMTENIAALIALGVLVGVATTCFNDVDQLQHCAPFCEARR